MTRMSTDIRFNFDWMPNRYPDRIQRAAVLYPLCSWRKAKTTLVARAMTIRLVKQWRARISSLMDTGWTPRPQGFNTFIRNCCPSFVYSVPRTRPCKFDWLCPFCYGRWVSRVWNMVDQAFPNPRQLAEEEAQARLRLDSAMLTNGPDPRDREVAGPEHDDIGRPLRSVQLDPGARSAAIFPYHVIDHIRYARAPIYPPVERQAECPDPVTWLRHLLEYIVETRGQIMKQRLRDGTVLGGIYITTVEPVVGQDFWRFKHRQLLMVPADNYPELPHSGKYNSSPRPSRSVLFHAVARVCRYPVGLMNGDPLITKIFLDARRPMMIKGRMKRAPRLVGTFGRFRFRGS